MALTTATAAVQILNGTWTAIQNMRERIQASKDNVLKQSYGNLLDDFNALRVIVVKLTEENDELRRSQAEKVPKPEIRQVGETNYYFVGDDGPYCQPCYDVNTKLIPLQPRQEFTGGTGRQCLVCKHAFFEVPRRTVLPQRTPGVWS
jgi:hypothetical protein